MRLPHLVSHILRLAGLSRLSQVNEVPAVPRTCLGLGQLLWQLFVGTLSRQQKQRCSLSEQRWVKEAQAFQV